MNSEKDTTTNSASKASQKKQSRPLTMFLEWSQLLAAIVSLVVTILAGIGSDLLSAKIVPSIRSEYLTVFVIVLSAAIGLGTVFYLAVNLYQRQSRQKQVVIEVLREKEKDFFQAIESDTVTLL